MRLGRSYPSLRKNRSTRTAVLLSPHSVQSRAAKTKRPTVPGCVNCAHVAPSKVATARNHVRRASLGNSGSPYRTPRTRCVSSARGTNIALTVILLRVSRARTGRTRTGPGRKSVQRVARGCTYPSGKLPASPARSIRTRRGTTQTPACRARTGRTRTGPGRVHARRAARGCTYPSGKLPASLARSILTSPGTTQTPACRARTGCTRTAPGRKSA